jgi:hypothetical protein
MHTEKGKFSNKKKIIFEFERRRFYNVFYSWGKSAYLLTDVDDIQNNLQFEKIKT